MNTTSLLRTTAFVVSITVLSGVGSAARASAQAAPPPGGAASPKAAHSADEGFKWGPAPAVFPRGAEMAVLDGDPSAAGRIFTVRLRMPDGYVLPAHWHPTDEHVTVIDGTFLVGVGDRFDRGGFLPPLRAGGFITAKAHMNHFAMARGRTVVQVHAVGPFAMTYVNPKDDPSRH